MSARSVCLALAAALGIGACTLNPQPYPPDELGASADGGQNRQDAGTTVPPPHDDAGPGSDAAADAAMDGGDAGEDAGPDASDGSTPDATSDGGADGGPLDGALD